MTTRLVLAAALALGFPADAQTVAFERAGGALWITSLEKPAKARKLGVGAWPALSPDGTRLAFNTQDRREPRRHLAVLDLGTGRTAMFKDVPSDNAHSPAWSPDGRQLVFSIFVDNDWHLAVINADGTGFRYLRKTAPKGRTCWGGAWAADGRSVFCQDMDELYELDLAGNVRRQWNLAKLFPRGTLSSGAHLAPSPDGRSLLLDVDMDEGAERDEWAGPPPAIWQLDLATGTVRRLTAPDAFAWHPAWINDREILANTWPAKQKTIGIARLAVDGSAPPELVIKDARSPSVGR